MSQQVSNGRRNYPKDIKNRKQEWWGIDKHLSEVNQELFKNEA